MAKAKSKVPTGRRADDYVVGEKLWEGKTSAGVIVSKVQCPERPCRIYMLLRNKKRQYTIYSIVKDAVCSPVLSRMIPESVVQFMFMQAFKDVTVPEKIAGSVEDRSPVLRKKLR